MRINIISEEKQIYEERRENVQWLKSIEFKLLIIEKEFTLSLDNAAANVIHLLDEPYKALAELAFAVLANTA